MRILPLGGAGEIGASCYLLELAGTRILIDAGIRVGSGSAGRQLPEFKHLETPPDTLVLTHAHTDHTGALPLVSEYLGDSEIHMTTAGLHLLEILQGDAVRHMDDADGDTGRVSYDLDSVERAIARVIPHLYHEPFCPVPGRPDIVFEYAPCGHILGAGALLIDSPEGRILWTGDYSVTPQPTIGGFDVGWIQKVAAKRRIDLVVTEGTYGDSEHPGRKKEKRRFIRQLERVASKGGKILIPAFAVGRAQDITHVIREAKLDGRLKDVPVYLDGMVRPVTSIYENIAHEMHPGIGEPLTLLDPDLGIFKANGQSRARLINGEFEGPAVVISSSGMLVGGQSVNYARAFVTDKKNAILISGYQDEESPGRALLGLRRGGRLRLGDEGWVRVKCQVGRYHTSAHADARQIAAVVRASRAPVAALIHGDPPSLASLRDRLKTKRTVILRNEVAFSARLANKWTGKVPKSSLQSPPPVAGPPTLNTGPQPTETEVRTMWENLLAEGEREYSEAEIARLFLGTGYSPAEREILAGTLADHRHYLMSGSRIGQKSYRPRPKDEVIDLMLERGASYQIPIERGDVVLFCDGSPDLHLGAVARVDGEHVDAVIPFSSRTSFRRDWVRCKLAVDIRDFLRRDEVRQIGRWLEGVMREARSLPALDPTQVYYHALDSGRPLSVEDGLALFYPGRDGVYSSAMHVAAGLALGGAKALFSLQSDGTFLPRDPEEAARRWKAFGRIHYVRRVRGEAPVRLNNGTTVWPTGVYYGDSFEARTDDDSFTRSSYRRVVLPKDLEVSEGAEGETSSGETVGPGSMKNTTSARRKPRKPRGRSRSTPASSSSG